MSESLNFGSISFLSARGARWDEEEFFRVGERFVERMITRFKEYRPDAVLERGRVLEIGCGVGRFLRPLSRHFAQVTGVDISPKMLATARGILKDTSNVTLLPNNGLDLAGIEDNSFDYCVCAGVFQHITSIEVILNYISEGLRVIRPDGLFLFQFRGASEVVVSGDVLTGAKVTARAIDQALASRHYRIRELSNDPVDKNATLVVVLEKTTPEQVVPEDQHLFARQRIEHKQWLSGVYEDIRTPVVNQRVGENETPSRLAFFD